MIIEPCELVDRLSSQCSSIILGIIATVMAATQYIGSPIKCIPHAYYQSDKQYVDEYCFSAGSYFIPNGTLENYNKNEYRVDYYYWVPLMFVLQALCFFAPSLVWKLFSGNCELKISELRTISNESEKANYILVGAMWKAKQIGKHLFMQLMFRYDSAKSKTMTTGKFMPMLFIATKLLYFLTILLQFWIIKYFLKMKSVFWGYYAYSDQLNGRDWETTGLFPRVAMCEYGKRSENGVKLVFNLTVQCALTMNALFEKVYICFWFWLAILGVLTLFSFFKSVYDFILGRFSHRYIGNFLIDYNLYADESRFVYRFLNRDGIFVVSLIQKTAGNMFIKIMLKEMLELFQKHEEEERKKEDSLSS